MHCDWGISGLGKGRGAGINPALAYQLHIPLLYRHFQSGSAAQNVQSRKSEKDPTERPLAGNEPKAVRMAWEKPARQASVDRLVQHTGASRRARASGAGTRR
jgi:hypothetical protein